MMRPDTVLVGCSWRIRRSFKNCRRRCRVALGLNDIHKQVSDDKIKGAMVGNGFRQQGFAIGPHVTYAFEGGGGIAVKWQFRRHELGNKNAAQGDKVWMQVAIPVGGKPE
ncbi:hypothetical protein BS627_03205 [Agrobacterium salinitolerans]|uniref:transporter n=1 Tax=Agrobacterium salinitolerans TaxID=1183413 RepID=UPI00098E9D10|nr:hypothetical protein BS627_03205 [Agrobacterium salinitolerans]PNQ25641.1 hypothetical protein C2E26_03265 [Rhizobium sp. YIC5082]